MVLSAKYGRTQWGASGRSAAGVWRREKAWSVAGRPPHPSAAPHRPPVYAPVAAGQGGAGPRERLTNAIKDTVSVLYWYEELSS